VERVFTNDTKKKANTMFSSVGADFLECILCTCLQRLEAMRNVERRRQCARYCEPLSQRIELSAISQCIYCTRMYTPVARSIVRPTETCRQPETLLHMQWTGPTFIHKCLGCRFVTTLVCKKQGEGARSSLLASTKPATRMHFVAATLFGASYSPSMLPKWSFSTSSFRPRGDF
jgi:hypothetical protein